jgi:hypothetical protein
MFNHCDYTHPGFPRAGAQEMRSASYWGLMFGLSVPWIAKSAMQRIPPGSFFRAKTQTESKPDPGTNRPIFVCEICVIFFEIRQKLAKTNNTQQQFFRFK